MSIETWRIEFLLCLMDILQVFNNLDVNLSETKNVVDDAVVLVNRIVEASNNFCEHSCYFVAYSLARVTVNFFYP